MSTTKSQFTWTAMAAAIAHVPAIASLPKKSFNMSTITHLKLIRDTGRIHSEHLKAATGRFF